MNRRIVHNDEDAKQVFVKSLENEAKDNLVYVDETGFDEHLYREYAFSKSKLLLKFQGKN